MKKIEIPVLFENENCLPTYGSNEAAGADIRAYIPESLTLKAKSRALIPTGLKTEIPIGYEIQIRPRSGLALKHGVTVLNTPGTIDSDYRGEIQVLLMNLGEEDFIITPGMRIAQMVIAPVIQGTFVPAADLAGSARGAGGFGHTGTH
jgi:dUTP pyrophosphatase